MQTDNEGKVEIKRLSNDTEYYNNVFKKTEKTVSVIFYILSDTKETNAHKMHIDAIKDKSLKTHELSLETLSLPRHQAEAGLVRFQYALVALDSTLKLAEAARVVPNDVVTLVAEQIDSVMRYINNHYLVSTGMSISELSETTVAKKVPTKRTLSSAQPTAARQRRVNIPAGDISTDAYLVYSQLTDRAERIKTVLEAKPQATVKDIAEVITDVSEKTIQRELNSLIEKGQVVREGERRWSKYSVSK